MKSPSWYSDRWRRPIVALALVAVALAGMAVRRHVIGIRHADRRQPLPFTAESALQYRAVKQIYVDGRLPDLDRAIEHPEGVRPAETDTFGAEYALARLARAFPVDVRMADRLRWLEAGWFCLGIPLMGVWIRVASGRWSAGLVAAFLYAVGLGSVQRSTGLEISHENVALPLLLAHLALDAWAADGLRRGRPAGIVALTAVASGLCLGLALTVWDLIQFYVALWMIVQCATWIRRPAALSGPGRWRLLAPFGALVVVGLAQPYFRVHGWLLSPILLPGYGLAAAAFLNERRARSPSMRWALLLLPLLLLPLGAAYRHSYGHFGALLAAKIRFLNVKPIDPARLTFDQRILWTPALHSATRGLVFHLFPFIPVLTLLAAALSWRRIEDAEERPSDAGRLFFFSVASFAAFILFVRFSVFAALFLSAAAGMGFARVLRCGPRVRGALLGVWTIGLSVEAGHGWRAAPSVRRSVKYEAIEELTGWLKERAAPSPVLADFELSASVLAYGDCPILLHPKFETERIRRRVEQYGTLMYKGTERSLHEWAGSRGARYLVYARGAFAPRFPEYQMRYMVNALRPGPEAPVRAFEAGRPDPGLFRAVWSNEWYGAYRIVSPRDEADIVARVDAAQEALRRGNLREAGRQARAAMAIDRGDPRVREIVGRVIGLEARAARRGAVAP